MEEYKIKFLNLSGNKRREVAGDFKLSDSGFTLRALIRKNDEDIAGFNGLIKVSRYLSLIDFILAIAVIVAVIGIYFFAILPQNPDWYYHAIFGVALVYGVCDLLYSIFKSYKSILIGYSNETTYVLYFKFKDSIKMRELFLSHVSKSNYTAPTDGEQNEIASKHNEENNKDK